MRKIFISILFICFCMVGTSSFGAENFLGAPVPDGGKELKRTSSRLEMDFRLSHDKILEFYKKVLKNKKDIKFRDWKTATYIEDDGARPWHSITISKKEGKGPSVVIVKDSWTWIIGTLILRYIGVFVVLMVLLIGMTISGGIISRSVQKIEARKEAAKG